ncbi:type ISP restriction/modification enzyme, partial [Algoriphagus jejuensis]|uniref:type ISP restriction/modification enzyme n=1 Tax=Algoriphagus jejuensis TaxID=419934 RepID=UPI0031D76430
GFDTPLFHPATLALKSRPIKMQFIGGIQLNDELIKGNICIVYTRQTKENFSVFISNTPLGQHKIVTPYDGSYGSPLFLYPESSGQLSLGESETRTPNLDMKIVDQIAKGLGFTFTSEKGEEGEVCFAESGEVMPDYRQSFAPIDLLDYIYAVLHSPTYRETYKEFLKIDFPRVPYPTDTGKFWELVKLGGELRALHLMESPALNQFITQYPEAGENEVEKPRFVSSLRPTQEGSNLPDETASAKSLAVTQDPSLQEGTTKQSPPVIGRVYINDIQYFDSVPELAWNFYIGGYQPAQKWLKDRKGRVLDFEDIMHYQRIIKALTETERVMKEIDGVGFMEGAEG